MLIEFRSSDRMLGLKAIGIYQKGIEAATAACEKVYVPTLELQTASASADSARNWVADSLDEMGVGEVRELDMPSDLALELRTACSTYLVQLGKLSEKQADLLVPLDNTNELTSHLTSLADQLRGQLEMPGNVLGRVFDAIADEAANADTDGPPADDELGDDTTVSFSTGRKSVTMSGKQFSRAAKNVGKKEKKGKTGNPFRSGPSPSEPRA